MSASPPPSVTALLADLDEGKRDALDQLIPLIYPELRAIAHRQLAREPAGHTLDSVALVHEAYLKLVDQRVASLQGRTHFYALAARVMRQVLVDHARARAAAKRGGGNRAVTLDTSAGARMDMAALAPDERLLALDEALQRLADIDEQATRVVEQRYFAGLTLEETASVLQLSVATVRRRWAFAKAWLHQELQGTA